MSPYKLLGPTSTNPTGSKQELRHLISPIQSLRGFYKVDCRVRATPHPSSLSSHSGNTRNTAQSYVCLGFRARVKG